jgi:hypothetical protein
VEFKPDFEEAERRVAAFWQRDCIGRPGLQVMARRAGAAPLPEAGLPERKTDLEIVLARAEAEFAAHHYLAEAVPVYTPGLVCSDMAAFLSDEIIVAEDTVWYPRTIKAWEPFPLAFDLTNRWWQLTRRMAETATERGAGRYLVGIPDFQVAIDIVSLLRGPEELCFDLVEHPAAVKAATRYILDVAYRHCYDDLRAILLRGSPLAGDWMGLFAPGRHDIIQCDFAALVSPRHFEEFCLPDIVRQCRMLDRSIFHLDGPDAVRHLDDLLTIQELDGIQWVPGAGKPPAAAWLPMLRRVQQAGKCLYITSPAEEVATILAELSPAGLMIGLEDVFHSSDEAQRYIDGVAGR